MEYGGPEEQLKNQILDRKWLEEFGGLLGLRVTDFIEKPDKENAEKIVAKARTLASNYGANAIVVNYIGRTSKVDQLDQMSLEAIAYDIQKPLI